MFPPAFGSAPCPSLNGLSSASGMPAIAAQRGHVRRVFAYLRAVLALCDRACTRLVSALFHFRCHSNLQLP